ncbi:MAG: YceI family protein [Vicingaceae bacterium]|nr:YceI family protein [Vicingaceae bacterium]
MKKILFPITVCTLMMMSSCGGEHPHENTETTTEATEEICFYNYAEGTAAVRWTAFKTNDKIAVGGQFNTVNVTVGDKSTKITDILETIKFNIPTASTNTSNEDRDAKIVASFFGAMDATDIILGQVKSAEGDNKEGSCTIYLTLNNVEKEVVLNYTVSNDVIKLTGSIDMVDFGAESAVASLNEVCKDLHKGSDGISKTWSNVDLEIEASLNKDCH